MTTAVLKFRNNQDKYISSRALLDSCSTVNLITKDFAKVLNLSKQTCSVNIGAVDGLRTVSKSLHSSHFLFNPQ